MTLPNEIRAIVADQTDPGRLTVWCAPLAPAASPQQ
jgi:hypothetical protein